MNSQLTLKFVKDVESRLKKNKLDSHVKESKCIPGKNSNSASRCLICHKDIPPLEKGWKTHLLINGCEFNVRQLNNIDK